MSGVNFNTSINTRQATTKIEQPKSEQIKEFVQSEDGQEKIALGLGALAVIAAAGIALKKGRPSEAVEEIKDLTNKPQIKDEAKTAMQHAQAQARNIAHQAAEEKATKEAVEFAKNELSNNANYAKTKKAATYNLTHDGKKVVKQVMKEHKDEILKQEKAVKEAKIEAAKAEKEAKKAKEALDRSIKEAAKKAKAEEIKAKNIAAQQASPHYEDGLIKQMINADKTTSKEANLLKKKMKRPAWANAEKRLRKMTPEQLQGVISNPKSSNIEVDVAKYLLG